MSLYSKITEKLTEAANEHARQALLTPNKDTDMVFTFGDSAGYMRGLTDALQLVQAVIKEDAESNGREPEPEEF